LKLLNIIKIDNYAVSEKVLIDDSAIKSRILFDGIKISKSMVINKMLKMGKGVRNSHIIFNHPVKDL